MKMTKAQALRDYIYKNIPIAAHMEVEVIEASIDRIILWAPIAPNINHKKTVFGGSIHSLLTLACWSLVLTNLKAFAKPSEIVIANSEIKYLKPLNSDFKAECIMDNKKEWQRFTETLDKKGKSRITLHAQIYRDGMLAVEYQGQFVAISNITSTQQQD